MDSIAQSVRLGAEETGKYRGVAMLFKVVMSGALGGRE